MSSRDIHIHALRWFSNLKADAVDVFLTNKNIHIFTDRHLPRGALRVLSYGLKFVPTLCFPDKSLFLRDVDLFLSSIRRSFVFGNRDQVSTSTKFRIRKAMGKTNDLLVERFCSQTLSSLRQWWDDTMLSRPRIRTNTLSGDLKDLVSLSQDLSLFISPTDKNLGVGIFNTDEVYSLLHTHLQCGSYRLLTDRVEACKFRTKAVKEFTKLRAHFSEDDKLWEFISQSFYPRTLKFPLMYPLPKIHKGKLGMRAICPSMLAAFHYASIWLSFHLNLVVLSLPSICSGTKSLVQALEKVTLDTSQDLSFITADVEALYPSIDTDMGLRTILSVLRIHSGFSEEFISLIMAVLELILRYNIFEFDNKFYLQLKGTAMGTPVAPPYANLFLFGIEADHFTSLSGALFFRRYIDDLFFICSKSATSFITETLSSLCPGLNYTFCVDDYQAVFLDLIISKGPRYFKEGRLDISLFQKPINAYFYIPWFSAHPVHLKSGFVKGELLRYIRNSSSFANYLLSKQLFYRRLRARGYPRNFLKPIFQSILYSSRESLLLDLPSKVPSSMISPIFLGSQFSPLISSAVLSSHVMKWWGLVDNINSRFLSKPRIMCHKGRTVEDICRASRKRKLNCLS